MQKWQREFTKGTELQCLHPRVFFNTKRLFLIKFFKICLCIPLDTFWQCLVIISCYSYEIWNKVNGKDEHHFEWVTSRRSLVSAIACLAAVLFVECANWRCPATRRMRNASIVRSGALCARFHSFFLFPPNKPLATQAKRHKIYITL